MQENLQKMYGGKSVIYTYPNEKIILVARSHWIALLFPLSSILFLLIFLLTTATIIFFMMNFSVVLYFSFVLFTIVAASLFATQRILEWYFHMYIISDKKIIEIFHSPLFFGKVTEILLSQVRCTEVDSEINGLLHHFFDIGHVTITFDRPTHEQEFVMKNIKKPNLVCMHLSSFLINQVKVSPDKGLWVEDRRNSDKKIFIEELGTYEGR